MKKEKFNHNVIGLISEHYEMALQASKVIQYLYWNKHTQVKELTLEKFVSGVDEKYYEPADFGDIDLTISGECGWNVGNINTKINKCYEIIKNKNDLFFDSDRVIYESLQNLRTKEPLVWIKTLFNDLDEKDNHIIIGLRNKEEQEFIKDLGGLLIEVPKNPNLEFQQKYFKTILNKFNNL